MFSWLGVTDSAGLVCYTKYRTKARAGCVEVKERYSEENSFGTVVSLFLDAWGGEGRVRTAAWRTASASRLSSHQGRGKRAELSFVLDLNTD